MQVAMSKKKKYLILLFVILALAAATAGIYLFINPNTNDSDSYTVDKYSDVTNWCDASVENSTLFVDCKALLINIDENSCFEVQVITKDQELKDLTVCENGDSLSYTNDVLGYKKLMPVDMVFTYTKEGILPNYSFNNVSFDEVDEEYIQGIVNEDIEEIMNMDKSSTTILNSFDFCPTPEILPEYIVEKEQYAKYWVENILSEDEYRNGYNYNLDDTTIRLLFACDSVGNINIEDECLKKIGPTVFTSSKLITVSPIWGKSFTPTDLTLLKRISLIYDNLFLNIKQNYPNNNLKQLDEVTLMINQNSQISEDTFCAIGKIYSAVAKQDKVARDNLNYIKEIITSNISQSQSVFCSVIPDSKSIDQDGRYLRYKLINVNSSIQLLSECLNLQIYINGQNI
ncbi:hypothetical protein KKA50_03295 [Patescibacteria group bacterium]|nr:hypothetical protein [Patescibacteria group bacterium]